MVAVVACAEHGEAPLDKEEQLSGHSKHNIFRLRSL
jgi:hypothetical protein